MATRGDRPRTSTFWHERAEEARAIADDMHFPVAKLTMEGIAHKYDMMAELAALREAARR